MKSDDIITFFVCAILGLFALLVVSIPFLFWGTIIYVLGHFLSKVW